MKTILIPTDFSKNALHALEYAQELFKCARAEFYIMHAFADEVYAESVNKPNEDRALVEKAVRKNVEKKLDDLLKSIIGVPPNPKHKWHTLAAFDSLVDGVNDFVNQRNIDLVVMGTKGETSDHRTTFGSYTVQLFKYVSCPVLAIPVDCIYQQPKVILFPTDYMLPYKRRELKLLGDIAGHFKSEVHCLYISDFDVMSHRQEDNKLFIKGSLHKAYLFFERTSVKNKGEAIMEYIEAKDVGMLTMVNSRHSFFEDMLYRSTIDQLGLKVKIPFLVMQNLYR